MVIIYFCLSLKTVFLFILGNMVEKILFVGLVVSTGFESSGTSLDSSRMVRLNKISQF